MAQMQVNSEVPICEQSVANLLKDSIFKGWHKHWAPDVRRGTTSWFTCILEAAALYS